MKIINSTTRMHMTNKYIDYMYANIQTYTHTFACDNQRHCANKL